MKEEEPSTGELKQPETKMQIKRNISQEHGN